MKRGRNLLCIEIATQDHALFIAAARASGKTLPGFVLDAAVDGARDVLTKTYGPDMSKWKLPK